MVSESKRERERDRDRDRDRDRQTDRQTQRDNTLLHKDKDLSTNQPFYKSVLDMMTNTATLNTSNKNTNNCGNLKYILRIKRKSVTV